METLETAFIRWSLPGDVAARVESNKGLDGVVGLDGIVCVGRSSTSSSSAAKSAPESEACGGVCGSM